MEEIWKQIKDFPEYEISSYGRLRKYIPTKLNNCGYVICHLYRYGVSKGRETTIHRLVAETFIPNPDNLSDVDHIDNNKLNNNVENLQWLSHKDNTQKRIYSEESRMKQSETWKRKREAKDREREDKERIHPKVLLMYVYNDNYYKNKQEFCDRNNMTPNEAKYFMKKHNIKKEIVYYYI